MSARREQITAEIGARRNEDDRARSRTNDMVGHAAMDGAIDCLRSTGRHHDGRCIQAVGSSEQRVRCVVVIQHLTGQPARYTQTERLGAGAHGLQHAVPRLVSHRIGFRVEDANDNDRRVGELREICRHRECTGVLG